MPVPPDQMTPPETSPAKKARKPKSRLIDPILDVVTSGKAKYIELPEGDIRFLQQLKENPPAPTPEVAPHLTVKSRAL